LDPIRGGVRTRQGKRESGLPFNPMKEENAKKKLHA